MKKITLAALLLFAAAFGLSAHAATLPYTVDYPLGRQTGPYDISLPKFNTTLGTLNSATLTVRAAVQHNFYVSNPSSVVVTSNVTSLADMEVVSSDPTLNNFVSGLALTSSVRPGIFSYAPGQTRYFGPVNFEDSRSFTTAQLADQVASGALSTSGSEKFPLECLPVYGFRLQGSGAGFTVVQDNFSACSATVTYDYTPFPSIPTLSQAMLALLSLMLLACGVLQVRRRTAQG